MWHPLATLMDAHKNFAVTNVTTAPSPASSGTSLVVTDASVFPATPFNATVCPSGTIPTPANAEIVRVTNISTNTLTITRAQEGSSARTILVGDLIACTATAKVFTDIESGYVGTATAGSNVTWTANSSGLSLDARGYAGTGTTFAGTNVSASATLNSGGLNLALSAPSGGEATLSYWANHTGDLAAPGTAQANAIVTIRKIHLLAPVACSDVRFVASISGGTAANNSSAFFDYSQSVVLYTRNGSTLSSLLSGSASGTQTWSSNATATLIGGNFLAVPFASSTILAAGEYWIANHLSVTNTATGGAATTAIANTVTMMNVGIIGGTGSHSLRVFGQTTNATVDLVPGQGLISTGATLATIPFTSVSNSGTKANLAQLVVDLRNYSI